MKHHWFFDFDGTLCDTEEDIKNAWRATIRELGLDLAPFEMHYVTGPAIDDMVRIMWPESADAALIAAVRTAFVRHYDTGGFPLTQPYSGVVARLNALKAAGCRLYIVTNKRDAPTRRIAEKFGWNRLFDGIWSYDTFEERYRKDTLLAKILSDRGIAAGDAVMVGDTRGDVDAGKANGMATIGVTWGYGSRDELVDADRTFDSARELKEWRFR